MLSQQYYTPCAISSIHILSLTSKFWVSQLPTLNSTSNGHRLLLTVPSVSIGAYLFRGKCMLFFQSLQIRRRRLTSEVRSRLRTRALIAVFGRAVPERFSDRLRVARLCYFGDEKAKTRPFPPVERKFGTDPSAWMDYLLKDVHQPRFRDCNTQQSALLYLLVKLCWNFGPPKNFHCKMRGRLFRQVLNIIKN